uniref:Peroxiredoxin-like 2 activated in M-CSF stimulated monocytes n=1 Tax=Oryzias latipes TaxID=8090 RepID=A0A3P9KLD1_ORYLA
MCFYRFKKITPLFIQSQTWPEPHFVCGSRKARTHGFLGNVLGHGFVLGGVFVIGRDHQGILLEHREMQFRDKVNISDALHAVRRITRKLYKKQLKTVFLY